MNKGNRSGEKDLLARLAQSDRLASMGMLAAGVAHEINNPLSYILYNLHSLSEDLPKLADAMRRCRAELDARIGSEALGRLLGDDREIFNPTMFEDVLERARDALAGTNRIKEIARALSTFSRVDRTELAPVNLQYAIEHAISMAYNEIKYRARLVKDFGRTPDVLGSDGRLAQVFLNLLINAAQAIEEGDMEHNEIRVRTWADERRVFAEVSDTGKGIEPEHLDRVFEPFYTTKIAGVGSGLGLSICKKLIEDLGGEISFESEVGKGTRFLIQLPVIPADWEAPRKASSERPAASKARGRILVVEDESLVRSVFARMLGGEHEVVTASSGEEGRAILEKDQGFDLLFFDLIMPSLSGMDLHAWLASRNPELAEQVVFVTGGAFTPKAREYMDKVGNLRVEKPFDAISFQKMTSELILASKAKRKT